MIENESPRTRSLLRQAARNKEGGKLAAAKALYRQVLEENPRSVAAWLGLAEISRDPQEKEAAYEQVLALESDNDKARKELDNLQGDGDGHEVSREPRKQERSAQTDTGAAASVADQQPSLEQTATQVNSAPIATTATVEDRVQTHRHAAEEAAADSDVELYCYRHPERSTSLRCYKCGKPICSQCAVKTPVGYLCPDCHREAEDAFFNALPTDYLLAPLVALPLSLIAGWLVVRFSGGIFMILLFIFAGGAVGGFIARLAKRVISNRRGRYIPYVIAACVILGVVFWAWPWLLALLAGSGGVLFKLAGIGVYLFTAASSAFYWAR